MSNNQNPTIIQIEQIEAAMKKAGVWSTEAPEWVTHFQEDCATDIWQWLQFIYLPMRIKGTPPNAPYLAPQLTSFIHLNPTFTPILQLTIELDSLTPTFHT